jgi:hypothetical protein
MMADRRTNPFLDRLARRGRRPDPRFVFVVTYGRSGSTLTQGLLNALPHTLVRGENDLYLLPLYRAWAGVSEVRRKHAKNARQGTRSAFYGIDELQPDDFVTSTRDLTLTQLYGSVPRRDVDVLGFKEVRWHRIEPDETEGFFAFFERLFPGARYVLNRRDHEQVSTSGFWQKQDPDDVQRAIGRVEQIQAFLTRTRPGRTLETRYEQLTSEQSADSERALRELSRFTLGWSDDQVLERMHATLSEGHGPRPFGRSRSGARAAR